MVLLLSALHIVRQTVRGIYWVVPTAVMLSADRPCVLVEMAST